MQPSGFPGRSMATPYHRLIVCAMLLKLRLLCEFSDRAEMPHRKLA